MSLRFYFGPSGAGKSRAVYQEIIERAGENPGQNFLVIVPDQFTMQTQKELTLLNPKGGILNIDVLSFGRLSHRVLEEVGSQEIPVLDDTGKSLVLQKVAATLRPKLPTLGSLLQKQGYIHEVKSAISEFMQYGLGVEDVEKLVQFAEKRGALRNKLEDLGVLYRGFLDYIHGNFVTVEETLDVLRRRLAESALIPGSVVVFDGFTGFTPIQNRLIQELMRLAEETIVTVTIGEGEDPFLADGEQKLFYLSKKTVSDLARLAKEASVGRGRDVWVTPGEAWRKPAALEAIERGLFRYPAKSCPDAGDAVTLFETDTTGEEVHQTALEIRRLVEKEGLAYRDIALIIGDLESYAPFVESEFARLSIPCFVDRTRGLVLNPMIEYIKSGLELYLQNFSYESVFHYLRCGMSGIAREEADLLENYVIQTGIRGYRSYRQVFARRTKQMERQKERGQEQLDRLNEIRERMMEPLELLHMENRATAKEFVENLYRFLIQTKSHRRLSELAAEFRAQGDLSRAKEYEQIYRLVMELLEQIHGLLGEEEITGQEFLEILEAGFGEIKVGILPQNVDRILVGDMERTRLKQVKVLFFLGINDGNIPRNTSRGGLISDMDREFLQQSKLELAPTPRQQAYIQRFYLYLNLTKPSRRLYLSYARQNSAGKSLRPAYLIDVLTRLLPGLTTGRPQTRGMLEQVVSAGEGMRYLAEGLRDYAEGAMSEEEKRTLFTLYAAYGACDDRQKLLVDAAFQRFDPEGIGAVIARALYGKRLENSVTRLETYASCAYRHFLQYGLTLKEREEFGFERVDMGNVYHGVLELFSKGLSESGYTWADFPRAYAEDAVRRALESYAATYGETVLYANARNEYALKRMERILTRTVLALQYQLSRGSFVPGSYEVSFGTAEDLDSVRIALSEEEELHLRGRIDRLDLAEDADHVYVKVIDYKSGGKQFDLAALYYGLQLQLVVYMNTALEIERRRHPEKEVVPAALLYYHVDDPAVESPAALTDEELEREILGKLRPNGVVNGDPEVLRLLDREGRDDPPVIPVSHKKDGGLSASSGVSTGEEFGHLFEFVNRKIRRFGREILDGRIDLSPGELGAELSCTYCPYRKVCGFDPGLPGCRKRKWKAIGKAEVWERILEELDDGD